MMAFAHHGINSVYTWMKIINPCFSKEKKKPQERSLQF